MKMWLHFVLRTIFELILAILFSKFVERFEINEGLKILTFSTFFTKSSMDPKYLHESYQLAQCFMDFPEISGKKVKNISSFKC